MPKVAIIGDVPGSLQEGFAAEAWEMAQFRPGSGSVPETVSGADLVVEAGPDRAAYKQKMVQLIQANVPSGVPVLVLSELDLSDLRECAIRPEDIQRLDRKSMTLDGGAQSGDIVQVLRSNPALPAKERT